MCTVFIRLTIVSIVHFVLSGAAEGVEPVGSPPASGIDDGAKVLSAEEELFLAREIEAARVDHDLEVYLVTYPILPSETIEERAARVRDAWSQSPHAIVVVYDQSLGQLSIVGPRDLKNFLSGPQLEAVFARAGQRAGHLIEVARAEGRAVEANEMLMASLTYLLRDPVLCHRLTNPPRPGMARLPAEMGSLLFLVLAMVAVLAGAITVLERRMTAQRRLSSRISYFPKTHMAFRLGAPFSGGSGVSLQPEKQP